MKRLTLFSETALVALVLGCASTAPVVVAPVGPNPLRPQNPAASEGQLQVFSALVAHAEGDNPTWYRHADYSVCDQHGHRLKRVDNAIGHYEQTPRVVNLPPGKYLIRSRAKDYLKVEVPVVIQPGRITRVHLDDAWRPPEGISNTHVVSSPSGYPVGWRAGLTDTHG